MEVCMIVGESWAEASWAGGWGVGVSDVQSSNFLLKAVE